MQVKFDEVPIPEEKLNRVVAESMDEIYKGCEKKEIISKILVSHSCADRNHNFKWQSGNIKYFSASSFGREE